MPPISALTVIAKGEVETVIVSDTDAVCAGDPLSCTRTVNVDVPLPAGVPEITPLLADSVSPAGRLPDVTAHVYPGVPPVALSVAL